MTSPQAGVKRALPTEETATIDEKTAPASPPHNAATATSAFRNVSACNRCRVRKNRCDQQLPACSACTKAQVRCVGYDPITKREIPRSYVYFLETRLNYFEDLLTMHNVPFDPAEIFDADSRALPGQEDASAKTQVSVKQVKHDEKARDAQDEHQLQEDEKIDHLVSNIGMVSVQGTSDQRYLGSTSGISFARVVLSAVKSSVPSGDKSGSKLSKSAAATAGGSSSMRDSYFGLQTKPQIKEAPFPDRELGEKLVSLYFEHANPQIPTLHRDEFMDIFERAYGVATEERTPRELYLLNIVFAMGAGIIWGSSDPEPSAGEYAAKRARLTSQQAQPEEYHASAIIHLGAFLSAKNATDDAKRPGSDLEELQAVLLLAGFALLRPVAPGLWYIAGVAMRLAVDLGLHYEDGSGLSEFGTVSDTNANTKKAKQRGRRQWVRDLRRRLWWCTYTFDRLVSTCVGRPFGITDQVITTEFPSPLDDRHITQNGIATNVSPQEPSYKRVSYHYFRLRLLQSEIVQVLQYQQAQQARMNGWNRHNDFMHTKLPSPFLIKHKSFRTWRKDVDQRLYEWKESAPHQSETSVAFSPQFLELNYWQAVIMLYRQSLSVPAPFAGEMSPTEDVTSPSSVFTEDKEDEDLVFLKCAEAGQKTLKLYRQLHRLRLVNYTYLATHHLFMAGISFLYAVWHSPVVRSRITLDDFDFTVLAATSVLGDLMEKCPPAEACRDAFERMSKATVQMCMSTPGFGFGSRDDHGRMQINTDPVSSSSLQIRRMSQEARRSIARPLAKRPPPRFDMDLGDLFTEDMAPKLKPSTAGRPRSNTARSRRQPGGNLVRKTSHPYETQPTSYQTNDVPMGEAEGIQSMAGMPAYGTSYQTQQYDIPTNQQQYIADSSNQLDPNSNTYNPDFMSSLVGGEFLARLSNSAASDQASSIMPNQTVPQPSSVQNMSASLDESWLDVGPTGSADGDAESEWGLGSGFGVGVGMGLDFGPQHDWSDGQGGFDLFDGFFFGDGNGSV